MNKLICPNCSSEHVHKRGWLASVSGKKQRYHCKVCDNWFSDSPSPSVLIFDIETLPIVAYAWGAWEQNLNVDSIIKDWCVLGYSAKWMGDDKMISDILTPAEAKSRNDKRIVTALWNLLDQADVVVSQNGRGFDIKRVNTRFLLYKLSPPSSYKVIDTLIEARKVFDLTFFKQEWMARFLGEPRKLDTNFKLWVDCDRGDKAALAKMRQYNEGDVIGLENIYKRFRPYIGHPNLTIYTDKKNECPRCFGELKISGFYYAAQSKYQEYRCKKCGGISHSTKKYKTP